MSWPRPDAPRAVRLFGLITGITLGIFVVTSYVVNPHGYWNHSIGNFPRVIPQDIEQKLPLLEAMHPRPQCLILGSSHVLMIEPSYVKERTGLQTFNWGINSAMVETAYAVFAEALAKDRVDLKLVIIGADTGSFTGDLDERLPRSRVVRDYLPFKVSPQMRSEMREEAFDSLFDWNTFRRSLKSMARKWVPSQRAKPLRRNFDNDGKILYPLWKQERKAGTYNIEHLIKKDMDLYPGRYQAQKIDPRRARWLEEMVQMAEDRGAKVVCYTTPLHPELDAYVREVSNYGQLLDQVKALLEDLSEKHGNMAWVDCSTLDKFGGKAEWYWDGAHPSVENTRLIVDKCLEAAAGAVQ